MTDVNYPSVSPMYRRADFFVHLSGLALILGAGFVLVFASFNAQSAPVVLAVIIYVACALISNLASIAYHFSSWHRRRVLLRRIDHAAIYPSITGTFTPFFVLAGTTWTLTLLVVCWGLTVVAIWRKVTNEKVQTRWSTASYLGLGALGLCALPDMRDVPVLTLWCILGGAACYVIGTLFYVRRSMPYRYAIWHSWVNFGGIFMFAGVWAALF
ncbi:MAG: hemolysin III family protein [Sulfitobacter sp.]